MGHHSTRRLRPALAALAVIAILGVSAAPGAFSLQQGSSPNSGSGPQWWNSEYAYRQNLTMTNPSAAPLSNYPVFVPVSFPFSHISDATAQLRLIDRNDAEVPSDVRAGVSSEGFVTSAWLRAFVSIPSSSSATYELYYGSPNATAPAYRTDSVVAQAQAGELSLDVSGSQPTTASFQVALGGTYSEQILSRVSYGTGGLETYGAAGIAQSPAPVVSPLSLLANISTSINVLSSVYSAGVLRYTQAYVLDNGTLIVAVLLSNTGDSPVAGVGLTDVVDATSLAALGALSTSYSKSGLLSTAVSGAYFGYDSNQAASSFEVGDLPQVVSDVSGGTLSNASSGAGTATALSWGMGTLAPGASAQLISAWGAGSTPGALV